MDERIRGLNERIRKVVADLDALNKHLETLHDQSKEEGGADSAYMQRYLFGLGEVTEIFAKWLKRRLVE